MPNFESMATGADNSDEVQYLRCVLKPEMVDKVILAAKAGKITEAEFEEAGKAARSIENIEPGLAPHRVAEARERLQKILDKVALSE